MNGDDDATLDPRPMVRWGVVEDGAFRAIPKRPMLLAGLGPPPFDVKRPDGVILHIVEAPTV